jgi:uncharacterized protein
MSREPLPPTSPLLEPSPQIELSLEPPSGPSSGPSMARSMAPAIAPAIGPGSPKPPRQSPDATPPRGTPLPSALQVARAPTAEPAPLDRGRLLLTGAWRNLCFVNYAVPPAQLERHLPRGLTLDTVDGEAFVSVVALDFHDLRLRGVPGLGYRRFPQINFRFYVRRGVVFLRELVSKRLLAWASRGVTGEPYAYAPLHSEHHRQGETLELAHHLGKDDQVNRLRMSATAIMRDPREVLAERFFTERHWSYHQSRRGQLRQYEVLHPLWSIYRVDHCDFVWDFGSRYGGEWAWLTRAKPRSFIAAEGSAVRLYSRS